MLDPETDFNQSINLGMYLRFWLEHSTALEALHSTACAHTAVHHGRNYETNVIAQSIEWTSAGP